MIANDLGHGFAHENLCDYTEGPEDFSRSEGGGVQFAEESDKEDREVCFLLCHHLSPFLKI